MTEETRNALNEEKHHRGRIVEDYGNGSMLVDMSLCENFVEGAEWYIEHIWKDVSKEIPTKFGEAVIVLCKNKNKPDGIWLSDLIYCWEGKWEPRINYEDPVKWAYLADILPNRE